MKIEYTEIFTSFQGEGETSGMPAVFLRLYGCNLNCIFCDEVQPIKDKKEDTTLNIYNKLLTEFDKLPPKNKLLIITCGEPYLQSNALQQLIIKLQSNKQLNQLQIHIETNGTIHTILPVNKVVISPKRLNKKSLDNCINYFTTNYPDKNIFKFVITLQNMEYIINYINNNNKLNYVLLQPETSNAEQITTNLIKKYPQIQKTFKISTQTHKFLNQK